MGDLHDPALANIVWHALHGPHARFRYGDRSAARYEPDVSVFAAVPDAPTADDWERFALLAGAEGGAVLFREAVVEPDGWTRGMSLQGTQMAADSVEGRLDDEIVELGPNDVDEMMALVAATEPGPFGRRTVELGGYVGIRGPDGELAAMAGHRIRVPGFVELSAVCTGDAHRGKGLASRLVRHVVARAEDEGDTVVLHAVTSNVGAIRLYEALGFVHVRAIEAVALVPPS